MMDWRAVTALAIALGVWFTVIVFLGASGFTHKSPELMAAAMVVPIIALMIAQSFSASLAQAEQSLPLDVLILISGARLLYAAFLVDSGSGLDASWAVPAAISGIFLAITAIPIGLFAVPIGDGWKWFAVFIWNLIGFVEALVSPIAAIVLGIVSRGSMISLLSMPTFLIAAFVMPFILWTHFRISARLWRQQTA